MVKIEVIEDFTLSRYDEIKDTLIRKSKEVKGKLFKGDIFECSNELADYLTKNNLYGRAFVKVIEIIPEATQGLLQVKEIIKEEKPKTTKKITSSKKTIAKK